MNFKILLSTLFIAALFLSSSCKKEDPEIPNEEEVITSLNYTLTPDDGGANVVLSFQDLDGDGGNAPVIIGEPLAANTTYSGAITLVNELVSPSDNITAEIKEEDEDHQFFFETTIDGLNVSYNDSDADGNPLGLSTKLSTTDAGTGTLMIILRHKPNKSASGVSNGDIANAGGETDIEVTFNVEVQ